jgi:hypothetical protein
VATLIDRRLEAQRAYFESDVRRRFALLDDLTRRSGGPAR